MKALLLSCVFVLAIIAGKAQTRPVSSLPAGKYETIIKSSMLKWERGDIIILPENKYKISSSDEVGDYKFSVSAQRIFFTSGPLKCMYAKTSMDNDTPAIVLPVVENQQLGQKLPSEVWCYHKQ
ncbi:MAG: hypothetical protein ACJ75B_12000 [Flavisolibacter sp.]